MTWGYTLVYHPQNGVDLTSLISISWTIIGLHLKWTKPLWNKFLNQGIFNNRAFSFSELSCITVWPGQYYSKPAQKPLGHTCSQALIVGWSWQYSLKGDWWENGDSQDRCQLVLLVSAQKFWNFYFWLYAVDSLEKWWNEAFSIKE